MADRTGIAWATATWNPWFGCNKVSEACVNCYAQRQIEGQGYDFQQLRRASDSIMYAPLMWQDSHRIFTCSWSDFFHESADEWRSAAWDIIKRTSHHRYLILTKRPENIVDRLPDDWGKEAYSHVALGVTVENQNRATERIPVLFRNWANLYFVSCEPLLGQVDLTRWLNGERHIDWVIAGGESIGRIRRDDTCINDANGNIRARYSDPVWFESLRQQCETATVSFFLKQLGQVAKCDCEGLETCERCGGNELYLLTTKRDHSKAVLQVNGEDRVFEEMPSEIAISGDNSTIPDGVLTMEPEHTLDISQIELNKIQLPTLQVRQSANRTNIKELEESIYRYGLLEPIVVAKDTESEDCFILLHGQRRLKAVQALHRQHPEDPRWNRIFCVIREQVPEDKVLIAEQLIENIQREDLSAFDKAEALMKYKAMLGEDIPWGAVEQNIGISTRRREQIIRVLKLPTEVRQALIQRDHGDDNWCFTERHARELMRLRHNGLKLRELAEQMVESHWGIKQLRENVDMALSIDREQGKVSSSVTPAIRYKDVLAALQAMPADQSRVFIDRLNSDLQLSREA